MSMLTITAGAETWAVGMADEGLEKRVKHDESVQEVVFDTVGEEDAVVDVFSFVDVVEVA